jgi:hypothetical protein
MEQNHLKQSLGSAIEKQITMARKEFAIFEEDRQWRGIT